MMESKPLEELAAPAWSIAELDHIDTCFRDRPAQELLDRATAQFGQQIDLQLQWPIGDGVARHARASRPLDTGDLPRHRPAVPRDLCAGRSGRPALRYHDRAPLGRTLARRTGAAGRPAALRGR